MGQWSRPCTCRPSFSASGRYPIIESPTLIVIRAMTDSAGRYVKGEKRAFWERVFTANDASLRGFLRRRIAHTWDVQDLAQETYVRMLRIDEKDANAIADPRAYLFTVASNLVKEHAMLHKRHALDVDIKQMVPGLEAPHGSAEDEAERAFRRRQLARTLDRLPPRCKAVLLMQHRDGMSYEEIAKQFGVSTHMVKKYVVMALTICRNDLAGKE
jgi:RNA polymerase sigma factor (sigma-70 family)